ncbi:MAG: hypothetical protein QOH49_2090 [Acidobacteriota bacterium]|jgi:hypothetical protein|nr:hypothetical protein [Acidobacteriota bacterium]
MIETNNTTDLRGVIAQRAYELYQLRGAHPGREFDDWLEAEREVLSVSSPATEEPPAPSPARKRAAKSPAPTTTPRKRITKKDE